MHAEVFMLADPELRDVLTARQSRCRLQLYITYQPCHHSGGHTIHSTSSCTLKLLEFIRTTLAPFGVQMEIIIPYLYRVHWRNMDKYNEMIHNANVGLRLLQEADGVIIRGMESSDWSFVVSLSPQYLQHAYQSGEIPFDRNFLHTRSVMDTFVKNFLEERPDRPIPIEIDSEPTATILWSDIVQREVH